MDTKPKFSYYCKDCEHTQETIWVLRFCTNKIKSSFTKEDLLFIKQFPHLFVTCSFLYPNMTRLDIKRIYNRVVKYTKLDKTEFETSLKMVLFNLHEKTKIGIRVKYYLDLYTKLGIMFADNEGNLKLSYTNNGYITSFKYI